MPRVRSDADVLNASLAATWAIAASGGAASVAELAAASGVSPRTFHRMFPRKEDCIRPALADARDVLVTAFVNDPEPGAWVRAFAVAAGGAFAERTRRLLPVIGRDPQLSAVWDHELTLGRPRVADALLHRGDEADPSRALTHATVLLAITHLALSDAASNEIEPVDALMRRLEQAGDIVAAHIPPRTTKESS